MRPARRFAGFLAVDAGWADSADSAGYVAGLLPTVLIFGRLFTTILWGWVADRIGIRLSIAASMTSVAIGNLCFGLATSLRLSLLARALFLGALNGFTTLMSPMCALAGPGRQAQAVAHVLAAGSAVMMAGPALGGLMYGLMGKRYPALPPSLLGAGARPPSPCPSCPLHVASPANLHRHTHPPIPTCLLLGAGAHRPAGPARGLG